MSIIRADAYGSPQLARCACGWEWRAPFYDWWADTLAAALMTHLVEVGAFEDEPRPRTTSSSEDALRAPTVFDYED